jgi:hypothetical protein
MIEKSLFVWQRNVVCSWFWQYLIITRWILLFVSLLKIDFIFSIKGLSMMFCEHYSCILKFYNHFFQYFFIKLQYHTFSFSPFKIQQNNNTLIFTRDTKNDYKTRYLRLATDDGLEISWKVSQQILERNTHLNRWLTITTNSALFLSIIMWKLSASHKSHYTPTATLRASHWTCEAEAAFRTQRTVCVAIWTMQIRAGFAVRVEALHWDAVHARDRSQTWTNDKLVALHKGKWKQLNNLNK